MRIAIIVTYTHPSRVPTKERSVMQSAVPYLLAALCPRDAEIEIYNEKTAEIPLDRDWDLAFFSYLHADYEHTKVLSTLLRRRGVTTIAGGRHAGHFQHDVLQHFDAVVVGEPEKSVPALIADFAAERLQKVYALGPVDPAEIPAYRWDLMRYDENRYTVPVIEASRGCPFTCNFCVLTGWEGYRCRPIDHVIRDVESAMRFNTNFFGAFDRTFSFADNNLGGSPKYLRALCEALTPLGVYWGCAVTYNILADGELVERMARAGCRYIYTGLESLSPEALRSMKKGQNTLKDTGRVLRRAFEAGILPSFGLLVGSDGDTEEYLEKLPEYVDDLGPHAITFLGLVSPYPETGFFRTVASEGRLFDDVISRDLDGYTLCHRPKHLEPERAVHHFKRLTKLFASPLRTARNTWGQLWLSDMPRYKNIILAGALEAASISHPTRNPERTFLAGRDPIEAWDRARMAELGLEPQRIRAVEAERLVPGPKVAKRTLPVLAAA
ncbi:B12-binding domain-containing radical SAM protein [Myxococcota bacterium]|nr:B12-binding domain-containing radical SAM protein [Myxococcota bacterium]